MAEWTDWADGNDLAAMSRGTDPLASMGYDPDELRADPAKRQEAMERVASPLQSPTSRPGLLGRQQPELVAQNAVPTPPQDQRTQAPSDEPPNPTLRQRPSPARSAGAAMVDVATGTIPETLSEPDTTPAATPASAPSGSGQTTPASPAKPDWQNYDEQAARGALGVASQARSLYTGAPDSPDTTALDTRIEAESIPNNPRDVDPVTGKPLYKPSVIERIGRGVAAYGAGGVQGVLDPAKAGATPYGAPNTAYSEDEQQRQNLLANDQQKKADLLARFKAQSDAMTGRAKNLMTVEPGYKDAGQISIDAQKQATDAAKEVREAQQQSPAGEAAKSTAVSQAQYDQRTKEADRIFGAGGGGQMRAMYLLNGKVPDPRQASAEEIAKGQALNVFRRQYGRAPSTMEEINQVNAAASGKLVDSGAGGGDPNLSGEDFLKTLSPDIQATVRAVGEGRQAPPSLSARSPQAQQIMRAVNQAYPGYDATKYPTYAATRRAFTSGTVGQSVNSFNTALRHLGQLEENIPDNGYFETLNAVENILTPSGSDRSQKLAAFDADATAVANEVSKAYKGGVITEGEYNHMQSLLSRNASPAKMKANIGEFRNLLQGKLQGYQDQWESGMPPGAVSPLSTILGSANGDKPSKAAGGKSGDNWFAQHPEAK